MLSNKIWEHIANPLATLCIPKITEFKGLTEQERVNIEKTVAQYFTKILIRCNSNNIDTVLVHTLFYMDIYVEKRSEIDINVSVPPNTPFTN